jgi:hypothetical protein
MKSSQRIVTRIPVEELWRDDGSSITLRGESLNADDITTLLHISPVEFVVADVGLPLCWVKGDDSYGFWKNEVKAHIAEPQGEWSLDNFPESYYYIASQWKVDGQLVPAVLLERHH